jgi:hypothetical protein
MCPVPAKSAASLGPRAAFLSLARALIGSRAGKLGPAMNTGPKSKPHGESILTRDRLFARGMELNNRHRQSAARYAALHLAMMGKEASCDA